MKIRGHRDTEESHVTMEAETGVMQLQPKECGGLPITPEAGSQAATRFSLKAARGTNPAHTWVLNVWPPEL